MTWSYVLLLVLITIVIDYDNKWAGCVDIASAPRGAIILAQNINKYKNEDSYSTPISIFKQADLMCNDENNN